MDENRTSPPGWCEDKLSQFFDLARQNKFASFYKLKSEYRILLEIDSIFYDLIDNLINLPKWYTGLFITRAHSSYRVGVELAMGGQPAESFMVFRSCLENALYGLYVNQNEKSFEIWIRRHDDNESLKRARTEFANKKLLDFLKSWNEAQYNVFRQLYERTIDFGAHPNERAFSSSLKMTESPGQIRFDTSYITDDLLLLQHSMKSGAQIGVCCLDIFQSIYRERFEIIGLSERINRLKDSGHL